MAAALLLALAQDGRPDSLSYPTPRAASATGTAWTLDYSSFLGGVGSGWSAEGAYALASDAAGNIILGGRADTPNFPFTRRLGSPDASSGAFVTKLDPTGGRILFSLFLADATVRSLATDAQGNIYAAGECGYDFPATNAFQAQPAGNWDAFVAKLSADGSQLVYATRLGGAGDDLAWSLAVDSLGRAYVSGWTSSTNFPVTSNAVQRVLGGVADAFVAILDPAGSSLVYATYLGGEQEDFASALALDKAGDVYLGGRTRSERFALPTPPRWLGTAGWQNAFVAKLQPGAANLEYLTFMGGAPSQSAVAALTVDATGHAFIFGNTDATNFPVTADCWQSANRGDLDNFLARLDPAGSAFVYATYLGGVSTDSGYALVYMGDGNVPLEKAGLAVDALGNAYVAGCTSSSDLAPAGIAGNGFGGYRDAYVAQIDPDGSTLVHLLYLGGQHEDSATSLVRQTDGRILVAGFAGASPRPPYFPITSTALQLTNGGDSDAFVVRLGEVLSPPPQDAFALAVPLAGPRVTSFGDNSAATKETSEPDHAGDAGGKSLWWSWTAPATGRLTATTDGSTFDTLLAIYTNDILPGLKLVAANDNAADGVVTSQVLCSVVAGMPYRIAVDGRGGAAGIVRLSLTLSAPVNDDFADRLAITNFPALVIGSNVDATLEQDDPVGACSVWWEWVSPLDGPVAISTDGSSFDTVLGVYTNAVRSQLGVVTVNDDYTNGIPTSLVSFQAAAGTAYQIGVGGGYYQYSGTIQLRIEPGAPPVNDGFTHSIWLTGTRTNFVANNYGATRETDEPRVWPANDAGDHTVWWSWQAPEDGRVTLTTEGAAWDTRLAVFSGATLSNLVLVAANDNQNVPYTDYTDFYASRVSFAVQSNTIYRVAVDGSAGQPQGTFPLALHFYHPFSILATALGRPTPAGFQLKGQGYPGTAYGVEVSTNLVNWELRSTAPLLGPSFTWRDTNATDPFRRFYRLVEAPAAP